MLVSLQNMFSQLIKMFKPLTPVQRAYLATASLHTSLGMFESVVIWRTKSVAANTVVFYLTSALVALTQVMVELDVKSTAPYFLTVFGCIFLANCFYLMVCLSSAKDKHISWVCFTFLALYYGICHALHNNMLVVGSREQFLRVLLFASTLANNFVPFESLLATVSSRNRSCPPQWIPLTTGLLQSLFGGLHHHRLHDALMAPADALGVAVHLFGLIVEMQSSFVRS
ncbi:hypothetical protein T265_13834 [Opisthorchis viverrini]|uniref:Uncharacterized protein n=1 Tax=Opisthorchis viverrini TaxID=6198 RepID=A0A074ZJQ6_OPIVI|nr:hypothetical protein T265_13834 [Opisthorchis viverrini]KER27226.1 hypothetical protein T265_13834 [Opisthorchis viverrini]